MNLDNPALRLVRAREQLSCELDGEIAILNLGSKLYFGLTDVAATIWQELETPKSCEAIVAGVMAKYDVEAGQCREDVRTFLGLLSERGLLDIEEAA